MHRKKTVWLGQPAIEWPAHFVIHGKNIASVKEYMSQQLLTQYNGDIMALDYIASDSDNNLLVKCP